MMKRHLSFLLFLLCLILAVGCQKRSEEPETTTLEETTNELESTTEEPTTEPATFPGLIGLHTWEDAPETSPYHNEDGSIALLGSLSLEAHVGDQYVSLLNVLPGDDGKLFITYTLGNVFINPNSGIDPYWDNPDFEYISREYFMVYDPVTGEKTEPIPVKDLVTLKSDGHNLSVLDYTYDEETWDVQKVDTYLYDTKGTMLRHSEMEEEEWTFHEMTKEHVYYVDDGALVYKTIGADGSLSEAQELSYKDDLIFESLYGAFTQGDKDYVQIYCRMMDLLDYAAVIDTTDGSIRYLKPDSDPGYFDLGPTYYSYEDITGADYAYKKTYYLDGRSITITNDQTFSEDGYDTYVTFLGPDNDRLVQFTHMYFNSPDGETQNLQMYVTMFDTHTGEKLGYATYDMGTHYIFQPCAPIELSDGRLLIYGQGTLGNEFYIVDFSKTTEEDPYAETMRAEVKEGDLGHVGEIPSEYSMEQLFPGEVWPQYADLKERATAIGEKYGLDIRISDECKQLYGDYLISAENRRAIIEEALTMVDTELAKYPADFFEKMTKTEDGPDKVILYLTGSIRGRGDGSSLDFAGGFQSVTDEAYIIMLSIESPYSATSSLHHELSHAIENRLIYKPGESIYDYEVWEKLGPDPEIYGDQYSYNYAEFGNEKLWQLTYFSTDEKNVYYIDNYSCTNAGEDRARLFENAMCREQSYVNYANCPHLLAKLNYYADCIEAVFGYPIIPEELRVKNWRELVFDE